MLRNPPLPEFYQTCAGNRRALAPQHNRDALLYEVIEADPAGAEAYVTKSSTEEADIEYLSA